MWARARGWALWKALLGLTTADELEIEYEEHHPGHHHHGTSHDGGHPYRSDTAPVES
ncbi:hypothetical protein [Sinomonas sp. RB5]